jgi:hypothetical protein
MCQAATEVNVLSPVIFNAVGADGIHKHRRQNQPHRYWQGVVDPTGVLGSGMIQDGIEVNLGDPSSPSVAHKAQEYAETSQNRQGLANGAKEVGLVGSTLIMGKPCTWGSDQQYRNCFSTCLPDSRRSE